MTNAGARVCAPEQGTRKGNDVIKPIIKIEFLMKRPSTAATAEDAQVAQDLLDTLEAHADNCVGLAANMIGVLKRIIVFTDYGTAESYDQAEGETPNRVMLNPEIIAADEPYVTYESCLSLKDSRRVKRFRTITVRYQDLDMEWHEEAFENFTAEVIQHQVDHCNGIVV